jgi:hypothetical protein
MMRKLGLNFILFLSFGALCYYVSLPKNLLESAHLLREAPLPLKPSMRSKVLWRGSDEVPSMLDVSTW